MIGKVEKLLILGNQRETGKCQNKLWMTKKKKKKWDENKWRIRKIRREERKLKAVMNDDRNEG